MKTCFFFGTFNPPHLGHLHIAEKARELCGCYEIIFVPAYKPPHKLGIHVGKARLKMVEMMAKKLGNARVSDIEFLRETPSYTYVTICEFYKKYKFDELPGFIIGDDAFCRIESWYKADELKKLVKFILFPRNDGNAKKEEILADLRKKGYNFERMKTETYDVSSTEIRAEIAQKRSLAGLVLPETEEFINENGLYEN